MDSQKVHEKMFNITIREMQIRTTMRVSPHTSQNGHHQKSTNSKCWKAYVEKGTLLHYWWEGKLVHLLWRTVCCMGVP